MAELVAAAAATATANATQRCGDADTVLRGIICIIFCWVHSLMPDPLLFVRAADVRVPTRRRSGRSEPGLLVLVLFSSETLKLPRRRNGNLKCYQSFI